MERKRTRNPKKKNVKNPQHEQPMQVLNLTVCLDRIFNYLKSTSCYLNNDIQYTMPIELLEDGVDEKEIYRKDMKYVVEKLHLCEE
jgi:hypothetical protein